MRITPQATLIFLFFTISLPYRYNFRFSMKIWNNNGEYGWISEVIVVVVVESSVV